MALAHKSIDLSQEGAIEIQEEQLYDINLCNIKDMFTEAMLKGWHLEIISYPIVVYTGEFSNAEEKPHHHNYLTIKLTRHSSRLCTFTTILNMRPYICFYMY